MRRGWGRDAGSAGETGLDALESRAEIRNLALEAADPSVELAIGEANQGARLLELPSDVATEAVQLMPKVLLPLSDHANLVSQILDRDSEVTLDLLDGLSVHGERLA